MSPKFALQSVLDYRHSRVEGLEIELAELLKEARQYQELLNKLVQLKLNLLAELTERQAGEMDLFAIRHLRGNIQVVDTHSDQTRAAIVEVNQRVNAKRLEMVQARQEEETLNILKEKEIDRFKLEQSQAEGRQTDDVYISQAFRRHQSGEAFL
jgi:flagellar export protein FliJ